MKNKNVLLLIALVGLFSPNFSFATRYVVKNPKKAPNFLQVVKKIPLGSDTYYVIDDSSLKEQSPAVMTGFLSFLENKYSAEIVSIEAPIELVKNVSSPTSSTAETGWHVRSLNYDQLPTSAAGRGVTVAILDTGVDFTHSALKNHAWTNPREIPNNQIDDDHNGYVDDVHGYNFADDNSQPADFMGHGTHCAGIVAADPESPLSGRGVAPEAKIMALKIIGGEGLLSDAVEAVKYAVDNGAKILSNSWRIYGSWSHFNPTDANIELLKSAIQYASDNGAIYLAAAGNESEDINEIFKKDTIYPIGYTRIDLLVGVASSDSNKNMSFFSNFGRPYVHLAAPGSDIHSTVPGNRWDTYSGTSMATPLVAGALARGLSKGYSPAQAIEAIKATSDANKGFERVEASGIVNLIEFLK